MRMSPWWCNQCPWKKRHQRIYSLSNHAQLEKAMGGYSKNWQTMKWVFPELDHTVTLIDLHFPGLWENKGLLFKPGLWYFVKTAQAKTEGQIYCHSLDSCNQILVTGDLATHPVRQYIKLEACCSEMLPLLGL